MDNFRVIIAGGGTGGHLFPALAIAAEIQHRWQNAQITFIGTQRGIESTIVPKRGYKLELINVAPLYRKQILKNLTFPFKLLRSLLKCLSLMKQIKPHLVIGTGGYVSGPVLYAASLRKIHRAIQEQNAFPGWTTRMLASRVNQVFLGFAEARNHLRTKALIRDHGNPVPGITNDPPKHEIIDLWGLNPDLPTVLITGGSQGAMSINQAVQEIISEILTRANLVWQTGKRTDISQIGIPENLPGKARIQEFFDPMNQAYSVADIAVSRAGALTLAELTLRGIPSILIPYPFATAGHQEWNAKTLVEAGGAYILHDQELNGTTLVSTIMEILSNPDKLSAMHNGMTSMAKPDALKNIVDDLTQLLQ